MFKKNLLLIFLILIFQQSLLAETIKVFDFVEAEFTNLKVEKDTANTPYSDYGGH